MIIPIMYVFLYLSYDNTIIAMYNLFFNSYFIAVMMNYKYILKLKSNANSHINQRLTGA
jgi:hypothetical protein